MATVAPTAQDLVEAACAGSTIAVARLISLVEEGPARSAQLQKIAVLLAPLVGRSRVIGLTGSPGVGKSTSTSALVTAYRSAGVRVGVLAIDPSSPFSGGALLGDRVRMQEHAADAGVFIRSMATRGHLGGLSEAVPQALRVLDAAGFEVIIIETVGVGQSEVDIAGLADSTVVLLAPGMGDGIQAAKAGLLEVGDVFVVNKADRDGADTTARELRHMVSLGARDPASWSPPVLKTVASRGEGVAAVVQALEAHAQWQAASGELERRRARRASAEITAIAVGLLRQRVGAVSGSARLEGLADSVAAGRLDPYSAADELLGDAGSVGGLVQEAAGDIEKLADVERYGENRGRAGGA